MKMQVIGSVGAICPVCGSNEKCGHFVGWLSDNGEQVNLRQETEPDINYRPIDEKDQIIKTGVSLRVYNPNCK